VYTKSYGVIEVNLYHYNYQHHLNGRMNLLQTKETIEYYDEAVWTMAVYAGQTLAGIIMTREKFYENAAVRTTQEPASRINREKNEFNDWEKGRNVIDDGRKWNNKFEHFLFFFFFPFVMKLSVSIIYFFCKMFVFSGSTSTASGVIVDAQERV